MSAPPEHQLFHPDQADAYVRTMRLGVDHLADALRRVSGPATGQAPEKAARLVADVDLDQPLGDPADALAEMSRIYLDDAIWFHEPTYAAHLNCPVVIPALLAEVFVSRRQLLARHLRPERRRHLRRAPPRRLDRGPDRLRQRRRRDLHQRRHPVQPAGPAPRPRPRAGRPGRGRPRPAADLRLRRRALQRPEGRPPARPRRRRGRDASRPTPTAGWTRARSARRCRTARRSAWSRWRSSPPPAPPTSARSTRCATDRRALPPARHLAARRRGVRRRAARLAPAAAPAGRHRARRLGDRRLPQDVVPAGLLQRADRPRRPPPRPRHLARRLPQPEGRSATPTRSTRACRPRAASTRSSSG